MELQLKRLKKENIERFIEIGTLSTRDRLKGREKLTTDIKTNFEMQDISRGVFYNMIENNQIVGVCTIVKRNRDLMNGVDIFNIALKEDLKGKGYGKKLMSLIFNETKDLGFKYVFVSTSENISGFYEKCGMIEYGRIKREKQDRIYLVKEL